MLVFVCRSCAAAQQDSRTYNGSRLTASLITISSSEGRGSRRLSLAFFEALPLLLLSSGSAAGSSSRSKSSAADSIDVNIAPGLLIFRPAPALPVLIRPLFRAYWMRVSRASVCVSLRVGARRPSVCVRRWRIKRRVTLKGSTCAH